MAKPEELRDMSDDELETKFAEAKEELFNLRFQFVIGQLDNPMRIKVMRKEVARILTVIREREIKVLEGAAAAEEA